MHVMRRIAIGPSAPLMGMGERFTLGLVPQEAMVGFLVRRARSAGKQLSVQVARHAFHLVDGIPNDVQRLAYEAFFLAPGAIDEATIDAAMSSIVGHWAADYEETVTRLAPAQQRVLRALAREPRSAINARSFVDEVDVANANSVRRALTALEDEELVARHGTTWVVADAFFRSWLRQASP